jgi:ACS family hexuronate transporter-like MFS transporter
VPDGSPQLSAENSKNLSARVWWLCGLLFLATVLNYLNRQVLALTAERIMHEFHLTEEQFGRVISAFRYAYGLFQILGGPIVDAHGAGLIYPLAEGTWSLAGALTGMATSVAMLSGFRFMLGIGEAFNWPCALKTTQSLAPAKDRPLANGIFNSGAAIGALLAPVLVTSLTVYFSWRAAFVVTGALGGIWIIGWIWVTRPWRDELKGTGFHFTPLLGATVAILRQRGFWLICVSAIIINSVNYFLSDWIPLYLKTTRGFSFVIGNALSIVVYAGLDAGNILSGLLVRRLVNRGMTVAGAKKACLAIRCVFMLGAVAAGLTPYRYVAVACLALTALGVAGFLVIYLTMVQDLDPAHVGISSGLLGGIGNLAYGYMSPLIGRLLDLHETSFTLALMGILPWLAFAAIFFGMQPRND